MLVREFDDYVTANFSLRLKLGSRQKDFLGTETSPCSRHFRIYSVCTADDLVVFRFGF